MDSSLAAPPAPRLEVAVRKRLKGFELATAFSLGTEVVALFGPSGAGKSLTLRAIAGLLRPDAGRVALDGRVLYDSGRGIDLPAQRRRIGYVFQDYALFPHLSVADNIRFGLNRLSRAERQARVAEALRTMRLEGLESRRPGQLSGGQRQRVAVARVLVTRPAALLLDEPFSALDSAIRARLQAELLALLQELRTPTVLVTHNLAEAYMLSRRIIVVDNGRVLQDAARDTVLYRPATRAVARFMGVRNIFRGVVEAAAPGGLRVRSGGVALWLPPAPYRVGQAVEFCIRPEHVLLIPADSRQREGEPPDDGPSETLLSGTVIDEIAEGTHRTLIFRLDGGSLEKLTLDRGLHAGQPYDLQIELPTYLYQRLGLPLQRRWTVSLKQDLLHVIGPSADTSVPEPLAIEQGEPNPLAESQPGGLPHRT